MDLRLTSTDLSSELWLLEPRELPLFELDSPPLAFDPAPGHERPSLGCDESDLLAELSELANYDGYPT